MKIILIHGLGRTSLAMRLLGWRLRQYSTAYFGYACWNKTFAHITACFTEWVHHTTVNTPYIIVAHSLGGIITRASLPNLKDNLPQHLIMLAPPNQPAKVAKIVRSNLFYRLFTKDCGKKLGDVNFYKTLPLPTIPTTIIAGTKGFYGPLSPFGNEPNDLLVAVSETKLTVNTSVILIPARHTFIMNAPAVANIVLDIAKEH